jgi:Bacterial archaeo-eukaryotic release factor family 10
VIDQPGIAKLRQLRDPHNSVLSIYLTVPLVPAQQREVSAYLDELIKPLTPAAVARASGEPRERAIAAARQADIAAVRASVAAHAPDWLGRSVAIFACQELGLFEVIPLPGNVPSQAVVASRPYIRPLLVAVARSPGYVAAVVDRTHAWLLRISADGIETAAQLEDEGVRSAGFSGWYGLEAYNVNQRVSELARRHYRKAAEALERARRGDGFAVLVVAGHHPEVTAFLASLPRELRDRCVGSAVVDPRAMTPARVRAITGEVVARWVEGRERQLVADLAAQPVGGLTVSGLAACVAAVNHRAVRLLLVPDEAAAPGWACAQCGTLSLTGGPCAVCGAGAWHVPDLVEELIGKVLDEGGRVEPVRGADGIGGLAASLRFPLGAH